MVVSANLPKTGYTSNTPDSFLLNAGAWVKNLKWDSTAKKWEYDLIGATSGGSKITLKNNYRQVEVDGVFTIPVGADMIESAEGTAEMNFIEVTVENLKTALLAESTETDGSEFPEGYHVISPKAKISISDYAQNMAYIGTLSGSDKPIIIIFDYAICTSGLEIEPKDKEEAVYTVTFEARTGPDNLDTMALPIKILYPKAVEGGGAETFSVDIDGVEKKNDDKDKGASK